MRLGLMIIVVLSVLFGVQFAIANPPKCAGLISNQAVFLGTWLLESTRVNMTDGNKQSNEIWQFNADGVFKLTATDHRASGTITSASTYKVVNNTLKIAQIGRAGRFFTYKVCAKNDTKITLFGGLEGFYFLVKK